MFARVKLLCAVAFLQLFDAINQAWNPLLCFFHLYPTPEWQMLHVEHFMQSGWPTNCQVCTYADSLRFGNKENLTFHQWLCPGYTLRQITICWPFIYNWVTFCQLTIGLFNFVQIVGKIVFEKSIVSVNFFNRILAQLWNKILGGLLKRSGLIYIFSFERWTLQFEIARMPGYCHHQNGKKEGISWLKLEAHHQLQVIPRLIKLWLNIFLQCQFLSGEKALFTYTCVLCVREVTSVFSLTMVKWTSYSGARLFTDTKKTLGTFPYLLLCSLVENELF